MRVFSHEAMDTSFTVRFAGGDESLFESAAYACFRRIDEIEARLSRFRDDSDVAVVKALKAGEVAIVSPEFMGALMASVEVCAATRGAFDPTLGAAMDFVKATGSSAVDDDARNADFKSAMSWSGMNRLVLDPDHLRVSVKRPENCGSASDEWRGVTLDFGGVGKGYALDECARLVKGDQFELDNFLLDAGSSTILACGAGPDGKGWKLGVGGRWKGRSKKMPDFVVLRDAALSGSGFEVQGEHIIDPRAGKMGTIWGQSWTTASSAAVADALSTAAMSMTASQVKQACDEIGAGALLARDQPQLLDKVRSPLIPVGGWPS